ncbi:MAG: tetratricopeptide repeat protein, partial [Nannocystaceae bacterium]
ARHLASTADGLDRALHHGEQLLAQAPDNARAVALLADVLEQAGRPLDAELYLRKLAEQQRDPSEQRVLHLKRARLLARSRAHTSAAIDATRLAFNVDPGDRESSQILIKLHERLGDMSGLQEFFAPARTALNRKFAIGDVSTRDLQVLTHMAKAASRPLGYTIQGVLHAVDANFTAPPEEHFRPAKADGLERVRNPAILSKILHQGESLELTTMLACLESAMERLTEFFPKFDRNKTSPMPFNVKPAVLTPVLQQWCPAVGLSAPKVASTIATNVVTVLPGKQPIIQFGENLWMQGNEHDWRGLTAVALARYALGASQVRALDPVEFDLLLAAAFESVGVFNAITADPDPGRLKELTSLLNRSLPRKARKVLEQCCHQLSNENFTPAETARRISVGDLRIAYLLSGDVAGVLGAACLMDGVSGPELKPRLQKSRLGQQLLIDLVSDPITQCRSIAAGQEQLSES